MAKNKEDEKTVKGNAPDSGPVGNSTKRPNLDIPGEGVGLAEQAARAIEERKRKRKEQMKQLGF